MQGAVQCDNVIGAFTSLDFTLRGYAAPLLDGSAPVGHPLRRWNGRPFTGWSTFINGDKAPFKSR